MNRLLDAGGVTLSSLCLVHCLVLPFAGAFLPMAGVLADDERVHWIVVGLAAPTAWFAFSGWFSRGWTTWWLPLLGFIGVGFLVAGLFAPEPYELLVSVAGGLTLATAHFANLSASRHDTCATHNERSKGGA